MPGSKLEALGLQLGDFSRATTLKLIIDGCQERKKAIIFKSTLTIFLLIQLRILKEPNRLT